jgi:catechol 2,3-dioxygenase-like lactoylglutathione lyase family enzyme
MPISGVSHIAVGVSDMETALAFYCGVLGLEPFVDHVEDVVGMENVPAYQRRAVYLTWPGGREARSFIVLDSQQRSAPLSPLSFNDMGTHHFAFTIDDMDALMDRAKAAGAPVLIHPVAITADNPLNPTDVDARSAFIRDPDGNIIQLDEYAA